MKTSLAFAAVLVLALVLATAGSQAGSVISPSAGEAASTPAAGTASASVAWDIQRVAAPPGAPITPGERSLRMDAAGLPHVAFGGDLLYHAWYDGQVWQREIADETSGVGGYASLALDAADHAHISYFDAQNGDLRYATWTGTDWSVQVVDSSGIVGLHTSLALDAAGRPHIAYYDETNKALKYAYWTGTAWNTQVVDDNGSIGAPCSLALDDGGSPHIAYYDADQGDLEYAQKTGSQWQIATIDHDGDVGSHPSLALDRHGNVHISYLDGTNSVLKYAHASGAVWHIETLVHAEGSTSLVLDAQDFPHIGVFVSGVTDGINHVYWDGAAWQTEDVVGAYFMTFTSVSLALSGNGHLALSFVNDIVGSFYYMQRDGGSWIPQIITVFETVDGPVSLALDGGGQPRIGYASTRGFDLLPTADLVASDAQSTQGPAFYHRFVMNYMYPQVGTWIAERIGEDYFGDYMALALDGADNPYAIGLTSEPYGANSLRYAHRSGSQWLGEEVAYNLGARHAALAVTPSGAPHIVYDGLEYAWRDGNQWQLEHVADNGVHGSLVLDSQGQPDVSFYDTATTSLYYAQRTPTGWVSELVDPAPGAGLWSSLRLDAQGNPHIAYTGGSTAGLRYAVRTGSKWSIQVIERSPDAGLRPSLALDGAGNAQLCYYDAAGKALKYACQAAAGWETATVDSTGDMGKFCSIALDSGNAPHIAYVDLTSHDLKYAVGSAPPADDVWRFRGTVYRSYLPNGDVWVPGENVRLMLYGRNEGESAPGAWFKESWSDGSGFFNFYMVEPYVFDYFRLVAEPPEGYVGSEAWSEDGVVLDKLTVEWAHPLPEVHMNEFYFVYPTPTPTLTPSPTPTPTQTMTATPSSTPASTPSPTALPTDTPSPTSTVAPSNTPTPVSSLVWMPVLLCP